MIIIGFLENLWLQTFPLWKCQEISGWIKLEIYMPTWRKIMSRKHNLNMCYKKIRLLHSSASIYNLPIERIKRLDQHRKKMCPNSRIRLEHNQPMHIKRIRYKIPSLNGLSYIKPHTSSQLRPLGCRKWTTYFKFWISSHFQYG